MQPLSLVVLKHAKINLKITSAYFPPRPVRAQFPFGLLHFRKHLTIFFPLRKVSLAKIQVEKILKNVFSHILVGCEAIKTRLAY